MRASVVAQTGTTFASFGPYAPSLADDASFRGALTAGDGSLLVLGTPRGGGLGLRGPDPVRERLVAVGDELLGSVVDDLAANPVSVNAIGQVVARVRLADAREVVLRFDP